MAESTRMTVENITQKVLYLQEMRQQISDGHWSKSKGHNIPCSVEPIDIEVGAKIGLGDYLYTRKKRSYKFHHKDIFEVDSTKMLVMAQIANYLGEEKVDALYENGYTVPDTYRYPNKEGKRYDKQRQKLTDMGFTEELLLEIKSKSKYAKKHLRKDLKTLTKIWKTRRADYKVTEESGDTGVEDTGRRRKRRKRGTQGTVEPTKSHPPTHRLVTSIELLSIKRSLDMIDRSSDYLKEKVKFFEENNVVDLATKTTVYKLSFIASLLQIVNTTVNEIEKFEITHGNDTKSNYVIAYCTKCAEGLTVKSVCEGYVGEKHHSLRIKCGKCGKEFPFDGNTHKYHKPKR
jgi:hypothetical protein